MGNFNCTCVKLINLYTWFKIYLKFVQGNQKHVKAIFIFNEYQSVVNYSQTVWRTKLISAIQDNNCVCEDVYHMTDSVTVTKNCAILNEEKNYMCESCTN